MGLRPEDFISLAKHDLRRSINTVYYALFHTLAKTGTDLLVGATGAFRSRPVWRQTYRGLEYNRVKSACRKAGTMKKFPLAILEFGDFFVEMQGVCHDADYHPYAEFEESLTKFL